MTYEKPQRGNPHELTHCQHVIPVASIKRFANAKGLVEIWLKAEERAVPRAPGNELFYAKRVWDQMTEHGRFRRIEDAFQDVARRLLGGTASTVASEDEVAVNEFYALCYCRGQLKASTPPDVGQDVLGASVPYDKNEAEILERNGYVSVRPDGTLPGRHLAGIVSFFKIRDLSSHLSNYRWRVLRSTTAQFLVPDQFPDKPVMPIAPRVCLIAGVEGGIDVDEDVVRELNRLLIAASREFYFAHDLARCPR